MIAFGETRNNGVTSIMGVDLASPTPVYEWTAAYAAKAQRALINDPARPLQTLEFTGVLPAPLHRAFQPAGIERNGRHLESRRRRPTPTTCR